ncbi:hypothetical protein ACIP5Y_21470 [Nocardia sp. NPDC088792]|uniref:hypothetical protein n=1 Tax=Nocardia sp. NPDC088792 TaxID=3364332 RepID=UPI0037F67440
MTSPGYDIVPNTDEGEAYTAETVSSAAQITEASAYSIMNADVLGSFGSFGNSSSNGLTTTAQSIGSTAWGSSISSTANSALSSANTAGANIGTISSGVSGNITGASATGSASGVGPAVQLLNATVQAAGTAPKIDIYNQDGTWVQPPAMTTANLMLVAGGGGGAQGGLNGTGAAGGGGGPAGYSLYTGVAAASLPTSASVIVGVGGTGGSFSNGASLADTFQRADSPNLGLAWRNDSAASCQIVSDQAESCTSVEGDGENGCWNTYTAPLATDNYMVKAQLGPPSTALATDNFTGIYVAAPNSYSGASLLVMFVGSPTGGCGLVTQSNAPSAPYYASGVGAGQTVVAASSTVNFHTSSLIALTRVGNVFTGYVNGTAAVTWTDTGNTVPTGAGNRLWGIVTENNWPDFQSQYDSPAIADVEAADLPVLSQPGTVGGTSSFNGSAYQVTGGAGGVGGGVDSLGTRRPASGSFLDTSTSWNGAAGSGNQTNSAAGGIGAAGVTGFQPSGQAGGAGANTAGGAAGTSAMVDGTAGTSPTGGTYGPGSGGGGGYWISGSTGTAGAGAAGGFPGGGGGGGGATVDGEGLNGTGGPGGDGQVVVQSNFT